MTGVGARPGVQCAASTGWNRCLCRDRNYAQLPRVGTLQALLGGVISPKGDRRSGHSFDAREFSGTVKGAAEKRDVQIDLDEKLMHGFLHLLEKVLCQLAMGAGEHRAG